MQQPTRGTGTTYSSTVASLRQVGSANPSLRCAIGGTTSVLAIDVESHREIVWGDRGYFGGPGIRRRSVDIADRGAFRRPFIGRRLQRRASELLGDADTVPAVGG